MSKRNYENYDYNYNYQQSLINQIKVNKKKEIPINNSKYYNYKKVNNNGMNFKDNLYYTIEKNTKTHKSKIPLSLNKKNIKKVSEEKSNNSNKYSNRDTYKKTINTFSNENRIKEGNIIEDLQNNKYLRPMLGTSNINNKLLKCQIEEPMQNIFTLSLKNYFTNNIDLPFEGYKSPEKNLNDISDESKINSYNLKKKIQMDNNIFSPKNENYFLNEIKNDNSIFGNKAAEDTKAFILIDTPGAIEQP